MITELFLHNYKGFVNFRMKCGRIVFLMGTNGSGKTSLIEAIHGLAKVISEGEVGSHFNSEQWFRFDDMEEQNFELHIQLGDRLFRYYLDVGFEGREKRPVVLREEVTMNGDRLLHYANGVLRLDAESDAQPINVPPVWHRGAVAIIQSDRLAQLRKWAADFLALRLNPAEVEAESRRASASLQVDGSNFVSWFDTVLHADTQAFVDYLSAIKEVIPAIGRVYLEPLHHNGWVFSADLEAQGDIRPFSLNELSDGQISLIVLYAILHFWVRRGRTVALDEPDNYLALAEIEPFLYALEDAAEESHAQVFVISHHPEIYNRWARDPEKCRYFQRGQDGKFQLSEVNWEEYPGLSPAELVARGWQDG